jgi:phenylacetate-CoA ligase
MLSVDDLRNLLRELEVNKERVLEKAKEFGELFQQSAVDELQCYLMKETIKYAYRNCAYYREKFDSSRIDIKDLKKITDLPMLKLVEKKDLEDNLGNFLSKSVEPHFVGNTSGTTTGYPLFFYLSREEIEARRIFRALSSALSDKKSERRVAITLAMTAVSHSAIQGVYANFISLVSPIDFFMLYVPYGPEIDITFNRFIKILSTEFYVSRGKKVYPTILYGSPIAIGHLTQEMIKRGLDPSKSEIEYIGTTGSYIPETLRSFLEENWNAVILDTYSLAEHCGYASQYKKGCHHHFSLTCIPEVADYNSRRPIDFGEEGILILTSLYPFQQCIPLIRYVTGDVVVLSSEKCPVCGYEGISIKELLGRKERCLYLGDVSQGKCKFLSSSKVYDILLSYPEMRFCQTLVPRFIFLRTNEGRNSKVKVLIESSLKLNRSEEKALKTEIAEQIMKRHSWNKCFPTLSLDVELVPPYALPLPYRPLRM